MEALQVRRVPQSADLFNPGDYVFIAKRQPIRTYETVVVEPPQGFWRKLFWRFQSKKMTKVTELPQWPEQDTIVMACPHCNQPIGTTKQHQITMDTCRLCSGTGNIPHRAGWKTFTCEECNGLGVILHEPLTLDKPIACAYSRSGFSKAPTIAFNVKDGQIMPA